MGSRLKVNIRTFLYKLTCVAASHLRSFSVTAVSGPVLDAVERRRPRCETPGCPAASRGDAKTRTQRVIHVPIRPDGGGRSAGPGRRVGDRCCLAFRTLSHRQVSPPAAGGSTAPPPVDSGPTGRPRPAVGRRAKAGTGPVGSLPPWRSSGRSMPVGPGPQIGRGEPSGSVWATGPSGPIRPHAFSSLRGPG